MKCLKNLSDASLLRETQVLAGEERELLTDILRHLAEIFRRKLFSPKYQSLSEYAMKELGYSEDQAWRRISAMKLLVEMPEIEKQVTNGELNLSTLSLVQSHFRNERKAFAQGNGSDPSREEKLKILEDVASKSSREVARILIAQSNDPDRARALLSRPETIRPVSESLNEMRLLIDDRMLEKIARLKGLLAHKHPHLSTSELLDIALDTTINRLDPSHEPKPKKTQASKAATLRSRKRKKTASAIKSSKPSSLKRLETSEEFKISARKRRPSAALKRELWRGGEGRCEQCRSVFKVEMDHQAGFARGGPTTKQKMRLLCRYCSQRAAILAYKEH